MPLPGMEERLWTAGDAKQNRCGFSCLAGEPGMVVCARLNRSDKVRQF